jgi:hypothetical protein
MAYTAPMPPRVNICTCICWSGACPPMLMGLVRLRGVPACPLQARPPRVTHYAVPDGPAPFCQPTRWRGAGAWVPRRAYYETEGPICRLRNRHQCGAGPHAQTGHIGPIVDRYDGDRTGMGSRHDRFKSVVGHPRRDETRCLIALVGRFSSAIPTTWRSSSISKPRMRHGFRPQVSPVHGACRALFPA